MQAIHRPVVDIRISSFLSAKTCPLRMGVLGNLLVVWEKIVYTVILIPLTSSNCSSTETTAAEYRNSSFIYSRLDYVASSSDLVVFRADQRKRVLAICELRSSYQNT